MHKLKRVAAINDISGFGKCSLTVAIPILSSAGLEVCPIPTAILSTHTGGFTGYTYRDLTEDLFNYTEHWKQLDIKFSSIYSGFLTSPNQVSIVLDIIDKFRSKECIVVVDPAMADNGKMYSIFDKSMCRSMIDLSSRADILIPNLTEAVFMIGEEYINPPYTKKYIHHILNSLSRLGAKKIVLTGVQIDNKMIGAVCYDSISNTIEYAFSPKVSGSFHGAGDVFASFLLSFILNDYSLKDSMKFAVNLTYKAIYITNNLSIPSREGIMFEKVIPDEIRSLNLI